MGLHVQKTNEEAMGFQMFDGASLFVLFLLLCDFHRPKNLMMYSELEKSESSNHCTKRRARKSQLGEFLRQEEKRKDSSYIVSSQTDNTLLHDSTVAAVVVLLACIPALGVSVPGAVAALQHGLTNANKRSPVRFFLF